MKENTELISSLGIGRPFWRLQQRLGLLGPDGLPALSTALTFAAAAWLPPALLSAAQGLAWSRTLGFRAFLLDFDAYVRFIVAVGTLILMERVGAKRGPALIRQFTDAGLVPPEEQSRFTTALQHAHRRGSSAVAEAFILGIAYTVSAVGLFLKVMELRESWMGSVVNGQLQFSLAGWWVLLLSMPLLWFLVFSWFWRFVVLTGLLWDISRLRLKLVATHPDRSGGIGFLTLYPALFSILVFALSSLTASGGLQVVLYAKWSLRSIAAPFAVWVVLVIIVFVGPLMVFAPALLRLKRRAMLEYGVLACEYNRAFERKWVGHGAAAVNALGTPDIQSLSDLINSYQSIRAMRLIPVGKEGLMPLLVAIGLPWVPVLATQVPLVDMLKTLAKALL